VFAAHGHDLVLVARRESRLQELAGELKDRHGADCAVIALDLAADDGCRKLYEDIAECGIDIDILVNNAGLLRGGAFRRSAQSDIDAMIELNIAVPTRLCRLFLDAMIKRGHGRILNLASLGAFQPVPSLAVYSATKAYLLSFTEALGVELSGKGVTTTAVCPGFTDTDMVRDDEGRTTVPPALMMSPGRVARSAYAACMRGEAVEVPGVANKIVAAGSQLMPRWLVRELSGRAVHRRRK
jgi:short-subunit dehydrogenase